MAAVAVGDRAPAFSRPNQEGKTVSLDDFAGRHVLLWWYPKADTPGCTMEGCGLRDNFSAFEDKNTVILGISVDPVADIKAFGEKYAFPYDLLSDEDKSMTAAYGIDLSESGRATRKSVLVGPDGKVAKVYDAVKPADHPAKVLADLARLG